MDDDSGPVQYWHCKKCDAVLGYTVRRHGSYTLYIYREPACAPFAASPEVAAEARYGATAYCSCGNRQEWYANQAAIERLFEQRGRLRSVCEV